MRITLENCGKSYNRQWLFRNLSCTLQQGEKWAFLGSNGSGKSTLTLILAAQVWPTEGSIKWETQGKNIDPSQVFSHIALASPALELPEEFSLKEMVDMQGRLKPFSIVNPLEAIAQLCEFNAKTLVKPVANFSSGMKQRVKLCLAAMAQTPILVLDEPLTNLDKAGAVVFEKILENYTQNRLLVIASNRQDEYGICDKFLTIKSDGVVAQL